VLRPLSYCIVGLASPELDSLKLTIGVPGLAAQHMSTRGSVIDGSTMLLRRIMPHAQLCSLRPRRVVLLLPNTASSPPCGSRCRVGPQHLPFLLLVIVGMLEQVVLCVQYLGFESENNWRCRRVVMSEKKGTGGEAAIDRAVERGCVSDSYAGAVKEDTVCT